MNRFAFRTLSPLVAITAVLTAVPTVTQAMACGAPPASVSRPYSIEVLVDGRARPEYASRGRTYVEALPQREYAIRLTNRTSQRIAVALSVDGLNSIDAKYSSMSEARKWILDPYASIVIDGWQTSAQTARKFYFTRESSSYGAWLGKTENLGNITAAFFRERCRQVREDAPEAEQKLQRSAPTAPSRSGAAEKRSRLENQSKDESDELAATGIGRELSHPVVRVEFDEEDSPAAVIALRYEYREALVALGVLPKRPDRNSLARRERSRGFDDQGFAPDPYR